MIDPPTTPDAELRELVGIVVQGVPLLPVRPHLAFMWGPEPDPAPSLAFGRQRRRARAA